MSQPVQGEPDYPSIKDEAIEEERERCVQIVYSHFDSGELDQDAQIIVDKIRSGRP